MLDEFKRRKKVKEDLVLSNLKMHRMNDTSKKVDKIYQKMFQTLSGEQRLKMGFSMFEFGKKFLLSNLKKKSTSPRKFKRSVFLRVYGNDFPKEKLKKILARLT